MAAGMGIGAVAGFAIRMTTGLFDLFPAFLGVRFVLGMVLKKADDRRDKA